MHEGEIFQFNICFSIGSTLILIRISRWNLQNYTQALIPLSKLDNTLFSGDSEEKEKNIQIYIFKKITVKYNKIFDKV